MRAVGGSGCRAFLLHSKATVAVPKKSVTFIWTHSANEGERVRAPLRAASVQVPARLLRR